MMEEHDVYLNLNIFDCPRCGEHHIIHFQPLSTPIMLGGVAYAYYGICPRLIEPLILSLTSSVL